MSDRNKLFATYLSVKNSTNSSRSIRKLMDTFYHWKNLFWRSCKIKTVESNMCLTNLAVKLAIIIIWDIVIFMRHKPISQSEIYGGASGDYGGQRGFMGEYGGQAHSFYFWGGNHR